MDKKPVYLLSNAFFKLMHRQKFRTLESWNTPQFYTLIIPIDPWNFYSRDLLSKSRLV